MTAQAASRLSRAITRRDGLAALQVLLESFEPPAAALILIGVWPG